MLPIIPLSTSSIKFGIQSHCLLICAANKKSRQVYSLKSEYCNWQLLSASHLKVNEFYSAPCRHFSPWLFPSFRNECANSSRYFWCNRWTAFRDRFASRFASWLWASGSGQAVSRVQGRTHCPRPSVSCRPLYRCSEQSSMKQWHWSWNRYLFPSTCVVIRRHFERHHQANKVWQVIHVLFYLFVGEYSGIWFGSKRRHIPSTVPTYSQFLRQSTPPKRHKIMKYFGRVRLKKLRIFILSSSSASVSFIF